MKEIHKNLIEILMNTHNNLIQLYALAIQTMTDDSIRGNGDDIRR